MNEYLNQTNTKNEKDFHKQRVAFLILNEQLIFLKDSTKSHFEWAKDLDIDEYHFAKLVRGYNLNQDVVFYKGNFIYDDECIKCAHKYIDKIKTYCNLKQAKVYCGEKVGKIGELWKHDYYLGVF